MTGETTELLRDYIASEEEVAERTKELEILKSRNKSLRKRIGDSIAAICGGSNVDGAMTFQSTRPNSNQVTLLVSMNEGVVGHIEVFPLLHLPVTACPATDDVRPQT